MTAHSSLVVILLRFLLPASLLLATCLEFTLPSLVYFIAFLIQHFRPRYEVTLANFPSAYLLVLAVYSLLLSIAHVVLAVLVSTKSIDPSEFSALARSLAIPDYGTSPLLSVKLLLGPVFVLIVTVAALGSLQPNGSGRYFTIRKRKRKNQIGESSGSSDVSGSAQDQHNARGSSFEIEPSPATLKQAVFSKFARHMAGRGGVFWTTIACGFTGLSYSSILTTIYLAVFSFVVVAWAFHIASLHPQRLRHPYIVVVKSFRVFIMAYLLFIVSLQNAWFVEFCKREEQGQLRSALRLIGFVVLDTKIDQGWAYVTGFCSAVATFVFSGIFVNALEEVLSEQNDEQNDYDKGFGPNTSSEQFGYTLSYYETQFVHSILHLSSLGLLTWSLVFPGILTLPMMVSALAYFASKRVRHAKFFDLIIVYAILLQIAHFLFVAITTSLPSIEAKTNQAVVRLLGLRKFKPQFTMNLVQALALGLFCTNIFCKRYISIALRRSSSDHLGLRDFVLNAEFSAVAKKQRAMYSTIRVILDQLALTSLYLAGGTKASVLNSVFLLSLVVLCLCQAFGITQRQKVMLVIWTLVLAYSTCFLLITCTACRAIEGFKSPLKCHSDLEKYGIVPATKLAVVAYTAALVFSAIQVHFTWSKDQSCNSNPEMLSEEFKSRFWLVVRNYFLFLTYVALLLYPLVYPANFLSYGYVLFLAISIVVELLGPVLRRESRSVRPLIKTYWPTVVLFSICVLLARYIVRFTDLRNVNSVSRKWVFGFDQATFITDFHFTVGDASMLIIVSLQGRFFGLDNLIKHGQGDRSSVHGEIGPRSLDAGQPSTSNDQSINASGPDPATPRLAGSDIHDDGCSQGGQSLQLATRDSKRHTPNLSTEENENQSGVMLNQSLPNRESTGWHATSTTRGSVIDHSDVCDDSTVRRNAVADREKINQLTQKIRDWRLSLPVQQTEKFLTTAYNHILDIVRKSLLRYSFVLEACAILAAAVWLPGFSVFGAIYITLGCILLLSEQAFYDSGGMWASRRLSHITLTNSSKARIMKMLPIVLAILSFALMSSQYVYLITAKIQKNTESEYMFRYFGLQTPREHRTPIDEPAMLAHVLVFVTAFLQRVAVKWAAKDAKRIHEEERQAEDINKLYTNAHESEGALEGAVNIGAVLSGVGGWPVTPSSMVGWDNPIETAGKDQSRFQRDCGERGASIWQDSSAPLDLSAPVNLNESGIPSMNPIELESARSDSRTSVDDDGDDIYVWHAFRGSTDGLVSRVFQQLKVGISTAKTLSTDLILLFGPFWLTWGFDLTFMYLVVGSAVTRTLFSVIYVALVMAVSGHRRRKIARHWHHITLLLASLVLLQYFLTLGFPKRSGGQFDSNRWQEWFFFDSQNPTTERKYDVTFAFLAVICASMTLNAIAPGPRGLRFWVKKNLDLVNQLRDPNIGISQQKPEAATFQGTLLEDSRVNGEPLCNTEALSCEEELKSTTPLSEDESESSSSHLPWGRRSNEEDFTQRPMSLKNFIKLSWMRFSGSFVQLYMFAAAVAVTSIFNGILLMLSFYFLFKFTNVKAKKAKFFIVRFYVLSIVFVLVVYQAPVDQFGLWAKYLGLRKTENNEQGQLLLFLMVSLWLICQMQGRIYESSSFTYVVKFGEEDAKVRFKRAVHEHNIRKYERMLGRNKNRRAKMARKGRLERLKKLKAAENRSVDRLYQVCVADEMKVLRATAEGRKSKEHIFSSHVKKEVEKQENVTEGKLSLLLRFLFRGRSWRKYCSHPLISELRVFMSRYSAWGVYCTMLLAAVVNPSQLTALYPLTLFLYLILEQPRPPKQVWQFLMCYVCVVMTTKYILRETHDCAIFFVPKNPPAELCRASSGMFFDILVFLSLLWHRTVLYYRGLWDLQSTEEDMLLINQIHGVKIETDSDMKLTKLPDIEYSSTLSSSPLWTSKNDKPGADLTPISANQQCSDVAEVFKRKRESITAWLSDSEPSENQSFTSEQKPMTQLKGSLDQFERKNRQPQTSGTLADADRFMRSRTYSHQMPQPQNPLRHMAMGPRQTFSGVRSDTSSADFTRYISLGRSSRKLGEDGDHNMTEFQSLVHKSLMQSKVIPYNKTSERVTGNLAVFRPNAKASIFAGVLEHFTNLTKEHEHKAVGDYYILIFLVDFLSFVFVTFAFSNIFREETQELPWWRANFIRIEHLFTLIVMFLALVMDRIVYLTRSMRGKLILQYISVITYHVVIFYLQKNIANSIATKLFYMLRCVYFLLSGLQIRNGFPTYTTAQFLLRNYSTPGIILFEIYNFIPFLWLMRTLLDWAVVPSSLELFQYFRFVDIYIWLYRNRAVNTSRGSFPRKLGEQRRWLPRVYQGIGIFLLCSIALFLPFLFFSILNPFTSNRQPLRSSLSVYLRAPMTSLINARDPKTLYNIFTRTAFTGDHILRTEASSIATELDLDPNDLVVKRERSYLADFGTISDKVWSLPKQAEKKLIVALNESRKAEKNEDRPKLVFELTAETEAEKFKYESRTQLDASHINDLINSLSSQQNVALKLQTQFPVYLLLDSGATQFRAENEKIRWVCIRHIYSQSVDGSDDGSFWSLQSFKDSNSSCTRNANELTSGRNRFVLKVSTVSVLQVGGTTILTLYAAILFTLANFMRGFFSNKRLIIPYIDMPYTLHLYQLVLDIIYARQDNELEMEEILYNGLTDVYRDQHVLSKWSGERALKLPKEWWIGSEFEDAYYCYPSFACTVTEPYMTRIVE